MSSPRRRFLHGADRSVLVRRILAVVVSVAPQHHRDAAAVPTLEVVRSASAVGAVDFVGTIQAVVVSVAVPRVGDAMGVIALEFSLIA